MSTNTPIATQTLSGSASSVTFTNIPQDYTDLVIVCSSKNNSGANYYLTAQFNSDTGTNYSSTRLEGTGSSAISTRYANADAARLGYTSTTEFTTSIFQIQNYSNPNTYTTCLSRSGLAGNTTQAIVSLWRNSNAITSIVLKMEGGALTITGSTFSLYGIAAGSTKAQGGLVTTDGTYYYHTFLSSGIFMPSQNITADILVVAGGGGAGGTYGQGGGGAGGLIYSSSQSLTSYTNYKAIVGAGGYGAIEYGGKGSNSNLTGGSLSLTTALGGGASPGTSSVTNGGSGAGGTYAEGTNSWYTGSGTAGQGNNGGQGATVGGDKSLGGGGGGAGSIGSAASNPNAGNGGAGSSTYSSWGSVTNTGQNSGGTYYYAGGGGGGTDNRISSNTAGSGGLGGGGAGGTNGGTGTSGTNNTGGGGGGGGYNTNGPGRPGGSGGSGIVIVRYAV